MYKEILKWVIGLISQPTKAWHLLSKREEDHEAFLARFIYPLIGLVTVAAFLGCLFSMKEFNVEHALKEAIRTLVSSFGGFYLAAYAMNELGLAVFKVKKDLKLWLFLFVDVCLELHSETFARVFLPGAVRALHVLYRVGGRWPLHEDRGANQDEVYDGKYGLHIGYALGR